MSVSVPLTGVSSQWLALQSRGGSLALNILPRFVRTALRGPPEPPSGGPPPLPFARAAPGSVRGRRMLLFAAAGLTPRPRSHSPSSVRAHHVKSVIALLYYIPFSVFNGYSIAVCGGQKAPLAGKGREYMLKPWVGRAGWSGRRHARQARLRMDLHTGRCRQGESKRPASRPLPFQYL
jgi:hypothetical protein